MSQLLSKLRFVAPHFTRRLLSTSAAENDGARHLLSLLKNETDPQRILNLFKSAALSPTSHRDRVAYAKAVAKLKQSSADPQTTIRSFVKQSMDSFPLKTERLISHFIVLYGQGGLTHDALKLFDEMHELGVHRNVKTLNSLLFACVLGKDYEAMKRVFLEYPRKYGLLPDLDTYNTVMKGYCSSGGANNAYSILAEMERREVRPNSTTFCAAIAGFYAEEKFVDVGKMMDLMKRFEISPGLSVYNVRIQCLCKLGRSEEAKALLDGIISRGMKPNCVTYAHLIHGFCREDKLEISKSLFNEMRSEGLEPEAECYFTLVYYFCKGRDFDFALDVCRECMSKGWVPNVSSMKSLVDGLASIGRVDEAKEVISAVKERFTNVDVWSEVEKGLSR